MAGSMNHNDNIRIMTDSVISKPTIRIAQVLAGAPIGGAENFYTRLVCALAQQTALSQCAFTRPNPLREAAFAEAGVPVSLHRLGGQLDLLNNYRYRQALKQWQPDIVLTYMNRATARTPKGDYQLIARLGHYYDLKYYRHCDYWIGITQGICQYMIDQGFPQERVFHIPNFVDETIVEPLPRDSFNTPADCPLLLAAGRLHINKGFDVLLKALVDIPDAILWLAGDGPEKNSLAGLAKTLGVSNRVRFLGWRRDVNSLMRTADIFVCPSRHEGLGSIVPEAWFNQCPIVAARSQGPSELIENGKTGLLVDIDDIKGLVAAVKPLLMDSKTKNHLIQNAYNQYNNNYTSTIITEKYVQLFCNIKDKSLS